jgi:hypothetical protein
MQPLILASAVARIWGKIIQRKISRHVDTSDYIFWDYRNFCLLLSENQFVELPCYIDACISSRVEVKFSVSHVFPTFAVRASSTQKLDSCKT